MAEIKVGYCTLCRSRCGSLNRVEDGRFVAVEPNPDHPTGAALCSKGRAAPEILGSPRRLTKPLRRTGSRTAADAGWVEMSWDDALDEIAEKLGGIRRSDGAEAVAFAVTTPSGTPIVDSFEWIERFVRCFGSPNLIYAVEICGWHKDYAHALTFGRGIGIGDFEHSETIVLWGHNPTRTWLAQAKRISDAQRKGATLVVIDPKKGGVAETADLWLPVRPGADGALAMGGIRHLIESDAFDRDFVLRWTNAPFLVDLATGRLLRSGDLWPDADEGFVTLGTDGLPRTYDTRHRLEGADQTSLRGRTELVARDGRTVRCATVLTLLQEEAEGYTREKVASLTRIEPADLDRFYRLFENFPRLSYHSWTGVGQHSNATATERAIATLYALCGAVDRQGGNVWTVAPPTQAVNPYDLLSDEQKGKALGLEDLPLGPPSHGWITARDFCRAVLDGEPYRVRALMSFGTNFAVSQGETARNLAALRALDFHVHVDMFMNPTAALADIVLPANMPWEREALKIGFEISQEAEELVQLRQRIVASPDGCRADYDIALDLACRLGHADRCFQGSIEAGWNYQLEPLRLTVEDLRAKPEGIRVPQRHGERQYAILKEDGTNAGFATPSRRVELYSELLLAHGHPALPSHVEPAGWEEGRGAFPLLLSTAKTGYYVHSSHRHIASLRRQGPEPAVELSPAVANARRIADGDWVVVKTAYGSSRLRAKVQPTLPDGVLIADYGWWEDCPPLDRAASPITGMQGSNVNDALSDLHRDPVSGSVPLRAVPAEVERDPVRSAGLWEGRRAFRVSALRCEAEDVVGVSFLPADAGPLAGFLPGQHVMVHANGLSRAYSLVGRSDGPTSYDIAVKLIRPGPDGEAVGRMSGFIHRLRWGDPVDLEAPGGAFAPSLFDNRPVILFASGIGITPFIDYAEALARRPPRSRPSGIYLAFVCKNGRNHPFGARLRALQSAIPEFRTTHIFTQPSPDDVFGRDYDLEGRAALSSLAIPFLDERPLAYLCGGESFRADAKALLLAAGIPAFDILQEVFTSSVSVPKNLKPRTIKLGKTHAEFGWSPKQGTILDAADAAGINLPSGCRAGQCGSCCLKILSGKVAHIRSYDGPGDHCLTCSSVPIESLTLDA